MKKRSAKIVKNRAGPKVDRATAEALIKELARPERLAQEAEKLLRRLRDDPALAAVRFEGPALLDAAASEGALDKIAEKLVTDEVRAAARKVLEERAKEGGRIDEVLPYRVGVHLLEAEAQAKRPASRNPFWLGVALATVHELPLALFLDGRPPDEFESNARAGNAAGPFKRFLEVDPRIAALQKAVPQLDVEAILLHAMLGFHEGAEIALPLEATLAGPIEAARAARRRQALAGIGSSAPASAEQAKTLMAAVDKDRDRAVPAFRAELADLFAEAAADGDARRMRTLSAMLIGLEALPPTRNVPLIAAYEVGPARAIEEAEEWQRPLLHAVLGRPLDVTGYRAYAAALAERDKKRAKAFAEAALAHFPGDEGLTAAAAV